MDYQARPELTDTQIDCLGTLAKIVMQTMQLNSEAVEGRRALRMSQALQSFQDGKDSIEFGDSDGSSVDFLKQAGDVTSPRADGGDKPLCLGGSGKMSLNSAPDPENVERLAKAESPAPEEQPDAESSKKPPQVIEPTSESTFVRAANLLRESLDLHATGGVVFYNAGIGFHYRDVPTQDLESSEDDLAMSPRKRHRKTASSASHSSHASPKTSDVMSFSMAEIPLGGPKELSKVKSFSPIPEDVLLHLLQRYPRGKMWSFNHFGHLVDRAVFGTSEKSESDTSDPNRSQRRQAEAKRLCRYFPNGECTLRPSVSCIFCVHSSATGCSLLASLTKNPLLLFFLGISDYVCDTLRRLAALAMASHWSFSPSPYRQHVIHGRKALSC